MEDFLQSQSLNQKLKKDGLPSTKMPSEQTRTTGDEKGFKVMFLKDKEQ